MKFGLKKFNVGELDDFSKSIGLMEPIDYGCLFVTSNDDNGEIAGLCGFNLEKEVYPKFVHILIAPKHQRTRLLVILAGIMEQYLIYHEYESYVSYILKSNERMRKLAQKWGMRLTQSYDEGDWFIKPLLQRIEQHV